jgi:hypothetical protein
MLGGSLRAHQLCSAQASLAVGYEGVDRPLRTRLYVQPVIIPSREFSLMRIVNPAFGRPAVGAEKITARAVDWRSDPIALFSNSKPNARELLEGLKAKLGGVRPTEGIDFMYKESASVAAPAAMIEDVAKKYRAALLALGD